MKLERSSSNALYVACFAGVSHLQLSCWSLDIDFKNVRVMCWSNANASARIGEMPALALNM